MSSEISTIIQQICTTRGIDPQVVTIALANALKEAYKQENGNDAELKVEVEPDNNLRLFVVKKIVKEVKNSRTEISLDDAKNYSKRVKVGDKLEIEMPIGSLGRIATQTARNIVFNKIHDAEREGIVSSYGSKLGQIVSGKILKVSKGKVIIELDKGIGEMPEEEQCINEFYEINRRYRFLVKKLINEEENRHIILSRADEKFLVALFRMEIPEMSNNNIEIRAVARVPGVRSKVAVSSNQEGLDPVGACIGQRGVRIAAIMEELGNEKIDVFEWSVDPEEYIVKALSPAQVERIDFHGKQRKATVYVKEDQYNLAIGKDGKNVELASMITGVTIKIEKI